MAKYNIDIPDEVSDKLKQEAKRHGRVRKTHSEQILIKSVEKVVLNEGKK
jgi:hypothetical protein